MKKRILLIAVTILIVILSVVVYARFIEPTLLHVKSYDVETKKPIKSFNLLYFTDTHFGEYYAIENVNKIVDKINDKKPDIVVFGGDLLDNFARDRDRMDLEYLKEELKKIDAKIGKYAVWGNHDYGGGAVRMYEEFMTSCGFKVLNNEQVILEDYGIMLVGYDDYLMGLKDPSQYTLQSDLFNVIIAHEPVVSQFIKNESDNFLVAGHTHGGQVDLSFLTSKLLPAGSGQFVKGFYDKEEIGTETSLQMYTSSGIGMTRYPFRFLNIPEIIEIKFSTTK